MDLREQQQVEKTLANMHSSQKKEGGRLHVGARSDNNCYGLQSRQPN